MCVASFDCWLSIAVNLGKISCRQPFMCTIDKLKVYKDKQYLEQNEYDYHRQFSWCNLLRPTSALSIKYIDIENIQSENWILFNKQVENTKNDIQNSPIDKLTLTLSRKQFNDNIQFTKHDTITKDLEILSNPT